MPTIKCSSCFEWHHRPCVDYSDLDSHKFVCGLCNLLTPQNDEKGSPSNVCHIYLFILFYWVHVHSGVLNIVTLIDDNDFNHPLTLFHLLEKFPGSPFPSVCTSPPLSMTANVTLRRSHSKLPFILLWDVRTTMEFRSTMHYIHR